MTAIVAATLAGVVALVAASSGTAAPRADPMPARCAGLPRVDVRTPPGWCLGRLADAASGLRFPRRVLEVAPGRFWLVDMGSWQPSQGRLLEFAWPTGAGALPTAFAVLAERLDRPLGLVRGPDGQIWIGEAGRVSRTPIGAPGAAIRLEIVLDGLPADGAHPLKELAFGAGGKLYLNVGSADDACRDAGGAQPVPCPQLAGRAPRGAVWEATFAGPGQTRPSLRPFATGLRNSVALAVVGDTVLQGENSIDYVDAQAPPEELNIVRDGAFYGWPYCVGAQRAARGYEGRFDCVKQSVAPALLWPAHAAPLQMLAVPADAGHAFAGQLVVAWHGYRAGGHRIVSYRVDARGRPAGPPRVWVDGWQAKPGRPLGAPTGLAIDAAGRMLIVEDRNKTLLVLTRDGP